MRHGVLLAKEVCGFVFSRVQAYEAGAVDAYSPSATENAMEYAGLGAFYKTLSEHGRSHYPIGQMSIGEERDEIKVNGVFAAGGLTEDNASSFRVIIVMTLIRA